MRQTIRFKINRQEYSFFCTWKTNRFTSFIIGVIKGYPLCCVIRYIVKHDKEAVKRGIRGTGDYAYVPCGIFHKAESLEND